MKSVKLYSFLLVLFHVLINKAIARTVFTGTTLQTTWFTHFTGNGQRPFPRFHSSNTAQPPNVSSHWYTIATSNIHQLEEQLYPQPAYGICRATKKYPANGPLTPTIEWAGNARPRLPRLELQGQEKNNAIELYWKTSPEKNISHFEIQKSRNGIDFDMIGLVFSAENSMAGNYQFTDPRPAPGVNYYRVKTVRKGQEQSFSGTLAFHQVQKITGSLVAAPNPATGNIRLLLTGVPNGIYRLELRNAAGLLHQVKTVAITRYSQTEYLMRTVCMTPGIFWINFFDNHNNRVVSNRVVVQ